MGSKIRVLTVDDSQLVQEILRSIICSDSDLELVGAAANGQEAIELTAELRPDVIVMDIKMPELGGLEATERIMAYHPTPILVLTSVDSADVAFEAMARGALEVVQKPELDEESCRALIGKIKLSARVKVVTHIAGRRRGSEASERVSSERAPDLEDRRACSDADGASPRGDARNGNVIGAVIGVGSSTGGPNALGQICRALPEDFPASMLVVQHIADGFAPVLTNWLDSSSRIRVKEAQDGEPLAPGVAYMAPSARHMELVGNTIVLNGGPPVHGHRPSADVLLRSVAESCGKRGIGVILSGMGQDGARGARAIRDAGGYTMAQNEETCVVFGMPRAAAELDDAIRVLDPPGIAADMLRRVQAEELP